MEIFSRGKSSHRYAEGVKKETKLRALAAAPSAAVRPAAGSTVAAAILVRFAAGIIQRRAGGACVWAGLGEGIQKKNSCGFPHCTVGGDANNTATVIAVTAAAAAPPPPPPPSRRDLLLALKRVIEESGGHRRRFAEVNQWGNVTLS